MTKTAPKAPDFPDGKLQQTSAETLDVQEAAAMLKCSPQTVLELAECGELPGCKIGIGWVFLRDAIKQYLWLQTQSQQAERRSKSGLDEKIARGIVHETRRQRRRKGEAVAIVNKYAASPEPSS